MSASEAPGDSKQAHAVLRFEGPDGWHAIPIPVPPTKATPLDLLPAAREISGKTTAMALDRERAAGRAISCRAGCGACCRQLVAISVIEAESLAQLVAAMPPERAEKIRARFAAALKRLEEAGLLSPNEPPGQRALMVSDADQADVARRNVSRRYFSLKIACPFLEDESCSIHPDRPMVCREYHVTTPAADCADLYQKEIARVEAPLRMGEVLARTYAKVTAGETFMIPLVLSLEWSAAHSAEITAPHAGRALMDAMLGELGR